MGGIGRNQIRAAQFTGGVVSLMFRRDRCMAKMSTNEMINDVFLMDSPDVLLYYLLVLFLSVDSVRSLSER